LETLKVVTYMHQTENLATAPVYVDQSAFKGALNRIHLALV